MTLTPEQFNQLTTKAEFNELKAEVKEMHEAMDQKFDQVLNAIDKLAKNSDNPPS